ncbi:MAG: Polyphosphate:nucleotide phosphotransferase, family [Pseudonocardiales bacterium]|nr:Polyphosphate:nucleotide phosphotransferase, family [Pseudonocardiales bacterium]
MRQALFVPPGPVSLAGFDSAATPLAPAGKNGKPKKLVTDGDHLAGLQERLYAEATAGGTRSTLLLLQGMDTAGKGGVTNHVIGALEPIGVRYTAFKKPTDEERAHDFLWRVRKALPEPGLVGVFDRSHYEDVLVPRVHRLLSDEEVAARYAEINAFEAELDGAGTTLIKCFLHISYDTQRERLLARLDNPDKRWKFNEADLAERAKWSEYIAAYEAMLHACSPTFAPWYVVPSDSKRYRNWAVGELLRETLEELDPQYPNRDLDVEPYRRRLQPPN